MLKNYKYMKKIYWEWKKKFPRNPQKPKGIDKIEVIYSKFIRPPRFKDNFWEGWFVYQAVKNKIRKIDSKNTIIHATWLFPEGDSANIIHKRFKFPFLVTLMGSDVHYLNENSKKWRKAKSIIKNATLITSVSQSLYNALEEKNIVVPSEKRRITHTIYEFENFIIKNRDQIKKQLGFENESKIIFYAGALRKLKNVDILIEAFKELLNSDQKLLLLIAGKGDEEGNLKEKIKQYKLNTNVKFLGSLNGKEMVAYYNASDIFCLPSQNEGTPNVVVESLLCGTPIVASKVGGIPYIIENGRNGYLVEPGSVFSLRENLLAALNVEWNREELRNSVSHLSPQNVLKEYEKVYNTFSN